MPRVYKVRYIRLFYPPLPLCLPFSTFKLFCPIWNSPKKVVFLFNYIKKNSPSDNGDEWRKIYTAQIFPSIQYFMTQMTNTLSSCSIMMSFLLSVEMATANCCWVSSSWNILKNHIITTVDLYTNTGTCIAIIDNNLLFSLC